jgi:hypothetical protein
VASDETQKSAFQMDQRVEQIIERMLDERTASQAYAELEALGRAAVPFIIRHMDDRRRLPVQEIHLRNPPGYWEGTRTYAPKGVVDALAAILN